MKLIIAEKPSVAKDIAKILKVDQRNDGYFKNQNYFVSWAYGHLIQLMPPKYYQEKISISNLPILPNPHVLTPKDDSGARKQLNVLKKLMKASQSVICATDAGREGELIFRYIYEYLNIKIPIERLWISSLTKEAITKGFDNLVPGSNYDTLFLAAKARNESDWLVGLNGSIALTKANGSSDLLSVGRVQTSTLAIIVKRYLKHKYFVPEPYFEVQLALKKSEEILLADYQDNFPTKELAESFRKQLGDTCLVEDVSVKKINEKTPELFDLTALQRKANSEFGFSAADTLKYTQALYETHKVLTYPRTDSKYLSEDMKAIVFETFKKLASLTDPSLVDQIIQANNQKPFNDKKVSDHHAIIPTGIIPTNLPPNEQKIFDLVFNQFCKAFHKTCTKESTTVELSNNGIKTFKLNHIRTLYAGWRVFESNHSKSNSEFPDFTKNEVIPVSDFNILSKKTRPPKLLSEASLLNLMETAGKEIDDPLLQEAMKDKGIGTPATRASIIETLLRRNYIVRDKKHLVPTKLGITIIKLVKNTSLVSPLLTGDWEAKLKAIELNELAISNFNTDIAAYTKKITEDLITAGKALQFNSNSALPDCPKCKKGKLRPNSIKHSCTRWNDESEPCDFGIWKKIAKKNISDADILQLVTKKKTKLIKGFLSKEENKFDAYLILKSDLSVGFEFQKKAFKKRKRKATK